MTDIEAKAKSTPPLKAAWFEDDECAENELKAAEAATSTLTPSPSKEKEAPGEQG